MDFQIKSNENLEKKKTNCIITLIFNNKNLSKTAKYLDKIGKGFIKNFLKKNNFKNKENQILFLYDPPNINAKTIALLNVDKNLSNENFINTLKTYANFLDKTNFKEIISTISYDYNDLQNESDKTKKKGKKNKQDDLNSSDCDKCKEITKENYHKCFIWKIKQEMLEINNACYQFNKFKSKKSKLTKSNETVNLNNLTFLTDCDNKEILAKFQKTIKETKAINNGVNFTKDLANTPSNICTPDFLADEALKLEKKYSKITTTVLDKSKLEELKMNALLAVGKGSNQEPKLIALEYNGGKNNEKPFVLVGKGITFDTGGHSLKPSSSMIGMKYDMSGAAAVFGTLLAATKLNLPINVVGIVAAAENIPGGNACKPDDIIKSMSGTTIEILNTDAEGRLILCDAITYAKKFKPQIVIDIATLTGACVIALGRINTAVLGNHEPLINDLIKSGNKINDPCWNLPISSEYKKLLKSNFADIANIGGREGSTITAACFLSHFATKYNWAHLDIAGTATYAGGNKYKKGSTGRPVPLLMEYLLSKC